MNSIISSFTSIQKSSLLFFKSNFKKLAAYYFLLAFPLYIPFFWYQNFFDHPHQYTLMFFTKGNLIYFAINNLLYCLSTAAIANTTLQILKAANEGTTAKDDSLLRSVFNKMLPMIFASVVYYLLFYAGMRLFVLPGVYLLPALTLAPAFIVFEDYNLITALKKSLRMIDGHWSMVFSVVFFSVLLMAIYTIFLFHKIDYGKLSAYNHWYPVVVKLLVDLLFQFLIMYSIVTAGYTYLFLKNQNFPG